MEKKTIGYKLKPECEKFRKAAEKIAGSFIPKGELEIVSLAIVCKLSEVGCS